MTQAFSSALTGAFRAGSLPVGALRTGSFWADVLRAGALLVAACVLSIGVAHADPHDRDHRDRDYRGPGPRPGWDRMDARFHHDHYYPSRGYYVRELPRDRVIVTSPRGRYFYSGGVWYSPGPRGYVVIGAPIGTFVPVLPPYYTTVWVGGAPYYYANDTYYMWRDSDQQYEVVDPPDEQAADTQAPPPEPPSAAGDVFIYPKNGQSEEDQARDKYECHKWAQNESGFDPTQANGGVPPEQANTKRAAYQRAMGACLEGRGYSVK
jgi:Family of unknown function (DUF6515)